MCLDKMENGVWLFYTQMEDYDFGTLKAINVICLVNSKPLKILGKFNSWEVYSKLKNDLFI